MNAPVTFHDLRAMPGGHAAVTPPALFARSAADLTNFCERAQPIIDAVKRSSRPRSMRFPPA
jgi:hypothetical protein